jgi:hypothetical protein
MAKAGCRLIEKETIGVYKLINCPNKSTFWLALEKPILAFVPLA